MKTDIFITMQDRRIRRAIRRVIAPIPAFTFAMASVPAIAANEAHAQTAIAAPRVAQRVTIKRDEYGVPQIYAKTTYSLFYGYGYAMAQDRLFQLEMARRSAEGTVSEVLGSKFADFDKSIRANYWPASIQRQLSELPKGEMDILAGYAAGVNAWIGKIREQPDAYLPRQFKDMGFEPSGWTAYDVAMVFVGTMANRFSDMTSEIENLALVTALKDRYGAERGMALFGQLKWLVNPDAPTTVPASEGIYPVTVGPQPGAPAQTVARYDGELPMFARLARGSDGALLHQSSADNAATMLAQFEQFGQPGPAGVVTTSNVWLIGKPKARNARAILLNGPQFGWFAPAYTYGVGLHGAGFDIVGNTPFGYPCILFGHNGKIAWGSTAGLGDDIDIFAEQVDPDNPNRYFHHGQWHDMEKRVEIIKVKDSAPVTLDIYRTLHGIVIQRDDRQHVAYAKARAWEGLEIQSLLAWVHQGRATDWKSWLQEAAKHALTINWYYADQDGNIGYVHTGKYPDRRPGQDIRLPVPGTGEWDWRGLLPFSTNPKVYNPKQGWIANWNNSPQRGYPASDMFAVLWGGADRIAEISGRIEAHSSLDVNDAWQILRATSEVDLNRRFFLPYIEAATAPLPPGDMRKVLATQLSTWDGMKRDPQSTGHYEHSGPAIMDAWLSAMLRRTLGEVVPAPYSKWFAATGYATPQDGPTGSLNISNGSKVLYEALRGANAGVPPTFDIFQGRSHDEVILAALNDAAKDLSARLGDDPSKWRATTMPLTFRANNFFGVPQAGESEAVHVPEYMNRGTENNLIVFGGAGQHGKVRAWDVVPPGESGFIAPDGTPSPHYADQLGLYTSYGRKALRLDAADVDRTTKTSETVPVMEN